MTDALERLRREAAAGDLAATRELHAEAVRRDDDALRAETAERLLQRGAWRVETAAATALGDYRRFRGDAVHHGDRLAMLASGLGDALYGELVAALTVTSVLELLEPDPAAAVVDLIERFARAPAYAPEIDRVVAHESAPHPHEAPTTERLRMGFALAGRRIAALVREFAHHDCFSQPEVVVVAEGRVHIAHLGRGRTVRLRRGRLEPLTVEHDIGWALRREGHEAQARELEAQGLHRNLIAAALGIAQACEPDLRTLDLEPGDLYIATTRELHAIELEALLRQSQEQPLEQLCDTITAEGDREQPRSAALLRIRER